MTGPASDTATGLVESLSEELAGGDLEIPGFPDIAMKLNQAMNKEEASIKEIADLINSEPVLISRLLQMANSVAFNASGNDVADLQTAVSRLGFKVVLSAASSYAIRQMQNREELLPLRPWLAEVWLSSNNVAAICLAIAKKSMQHLANEAMTAGMLHRLGHLYLLVRAQEQGMDIATDPSWEDLLCNWHATVATEILLQWGIPAHIASAVNRQDALSKGDTTDLPPFEALLSAAKLYDTVRNQQTSKVASEATIVLENIELWGQPFIQLVAESHDEIQALRNVIA